MKEGSLSARRAWIEIPKITADWETKMSLSARRAWIEISGVIITKQSPTSLSARRAWIEIMPDWKKTAYLSVALRKESVDRNL